MAASVLPYLTEYFIPSAAIQKQALQQESHMATSLSTQENLALQQLSRLADESHLLPNYPILVKQPRFKHAAAAISTKVSMASPSDGNSNREDSDIIKEARAWAFAADAARSATQAVVDDRLHDGFSHAKIAEGLLTDLEQILGSHGDQGENDGGDSAEVRSVQPREGRSRIKSSDRKRPQGIWTKLDGIVGTN